MSLNEFEQLLKRYEEGNCTPEEKAWVEQWIENTKLRTEDRWQQFSAKEKQAFIDHLISDIQNTVQEKEQETPVVVVPRRRRLWWPSVAAACALLVAGIYISQHNRVSPIMEETIEWTGVEVEPGARKKLTLTDGTVIWLQAGSTVHYPSQFHKDKRLVKLDGEAFFEVAKDSERPFIIQADGLETEVLGTSFNISAFKELDKKTVSLVEGRLAVRVLDDKGERSGEIFLSPSEEAIFDVTQLKLSKSDLPVFGSADDFRIGNLQFEETPLEDVLFRLEKAYNIRVSFNKATVSKHRVTGAFSVSEPVKEVLQSVAKSVRGRVVWKSDDLVEFRL